MSRPFVLCAVALLLALPIVAQTPCNLDMSMTCTSGNCTATTRNAGSNSCDGTYEIGFFGLGAATDVSFSGFSNSLGLATCYDASTIPGLAESFALCFGPSSLGPGASFTMNVHAQTTVPSTGQPQFLAFTVVADPTTADNLAFVYVYDTGGSPQLTCTPTVNVPSLTQSDVRYTVSWSPVVDTNAMTFMIEESTTPDFSAITDSRAVSTLSAQFRHGVSTPTIYYYRVRAVSCNGSPGENSRVVSIVVQTIPTATGRSADAVAPVGSTDPVSVKVFIPGPNSKQALDVPFTASVDKSYLTVTPASGTIPPGGTTVTVTANPTNLPPGANTGTLSVTSNGGTSNKSVSISLVTPVGPGGKTAPPANALIIPVVGHALGANGPFQSDVRLTNASDATITYQIGFTKTGTDATQSEKKTTISVDGGQTIALNDIARDFFGIGATDDPKDFATGSLEILPQNTTSTLTYASSRTYTYNEKGTYGQFIAAMPFSTFATNASLIPMPGVPPQTTSLLSLQQVAQSAKFRTNLGLVEGSGATAVGRINFYDDSGTLMKTVPYSLLPGEQQQKNLLFDYGVSNLTDGRIEVTVDSPTGAVTAYASVIDNITSDPLAVMPAQAAKINATRYVLPGMAAVTVANFFSDARFFNGGNTAVTVTPTFYPQGGAPISAAPITIAKGEVKAFDNVLPSLFGPSANEKSGSIVLTTSVPSSLVVTGRTYSNSTDPKQVGGTYGQFIPGVSPDQGIGLGDRPLQILQLEESQNYRSNVGFAELTGNPVDLVVSAVIPESKVSASVPVHLDPNQFVQLGHVLNSFGFPPNVYNARITVRVARGAGRATAYGSVIDNVTNDPTYVPAQQ